jgi:hypothetical protein
MLVAAALVAAHLVAAPEAHTVDVDVDAEGAAGAAATEAEPQNGVSARLLLGAAHIEGDKQSTRPLVGVGLAYERNFFENLIAVELALEALTTDNAQSYVAELVFEKPLELNDTIGVYFGGGPTIGVDVDGDRFVPGAGGLALIGGEWFFGGGLEAFVELDAAFFYFDEVVVEADVGTGLLYRF